MNWELHRANILKESEMMAQPNGEGMRNLKKVVTPTALILVDGDVVKTYMHANVEFTEESSEENIAAIWKHIKDKRIFNLLIPDPTTQILIDVRNYENEELEEIKRAEAIVIRSLAHRLLAKFYLKPRKGRYPTKVFESEKEALEWFEKLRKK